MVFSSIFFLFYFFPIVFIVNKLLPRKYKNLWLFFASLFFYAWGEPIYILIMLFSTFFDYTNGRLMVGASDQKKKLILINSIVVNLGILFFFKYSDFFIKVINEFGFNIKPLNLALPLGISFYTFQTLSYTIDCYRGRVNIADNIVDFGLFVTSFPQLIAGPIVKYIDVEKELKQRDDSLNSYNVGMRIFIEGLFLKVLLANKFGEVFNSFTFADASSKTLIFLKLVAYSLQIYFDFAGYSKMAIGMGRMLGFHFPENFNYPYISKSITEFWSRWHMTLSSWFKEYVYIPLGGNRVGRARHIFNIFVVWFLTGFWHGADYNFILWGMYFFVVLILEKYFFLKILEKVPKFISRIYTLIIIMFSWVLFTSTDLKDIGAFFTSLGSKPFFSGEVTSFLLQYGILFIIGILFSTPKPKEMFEKQKEAVQIVMLTIVFILSIAALVAGNYNPFLYFRF